VLQIFNWRDDYPDGSKTTLMTSVQKMTPFFRKVTLQTDYSKTWNRTQVLHTRLAPDARQGFTYGSCLLYKQSVMTSLAQYVVKHSVSSAAADDDDVKLDMSVTTWRAKMKRMKSTSC